MIVSSNKFNEVNTWRSLTVIPITSSGRWVSGSLTTVVLAEGEANLPRLSAALAHQITTVDRSKLLGRAIDRKRTLWHDQLEPGAVVGIFDVRRRSAAVRGSKSHGPSCVSSDADRAARAEMARVADCLSVETIVSVDVPLSWQGADGCMLTKQALKDAQGLENQTRIALSDQTP